MKKIIALVLIALSLTACEARNTSIAAEAQNPTDATLERYIERFGAPDKYGVVCYQSVVSAANLSCVKVQ